MPVPVSHLVSVRTPGGFRMMQRAYDLTNDIAPPPGNSSVSPAPAPASFPKFSVPAPSPYTLPMQQRLTNGGGLTPQPGLTVAPGPSEPMAPVIPSSNPAIYDGGTGTTPDQLVTDVKKLPTPVLVGGLLFLLLLVRR